MTARDVIESAYRVHLGLSDCDLDRDEVKLLDDLIAALTAARLIIVGPLPEPIALEGGRCGWPLVAILVTVVSEDGYVWPIGIDSGPLNPDEAEELAAALLAAAKHAREVDQ